jgi:NAD(P)-dependent dehydrogenase (short-subunit alcohol dehydrogenase family)/preprotein translocase subunit SecF
VPIVVKLGDESRQDLATLERLMVPGSRGPVMLGQVASIEVAGGPAVIDRYDRQRNINFEIELSGMPLGDVTQAVQQLPALQSLPPGVKVVEVGDAEVMGELFASFGLAMMIGVLCIYIVLVLLFKGFLHPITILAALPLSLGGAFVGLLIAQKSFSMPSLIGLIMLMGIATKNSILLVEYAIEARRGKPAEGDHPAVPPMSRWDAILDACHKRARPIVMTTIAMGAGMLPIAVGWGAADASFRSPMAIAVIGGLLTSTVLSLLVIPVVFTYLDDLGQWSARMFRKLTQSMSNKVAMVVGGGSGMGAAAARKLAQDGFQVAVMSSSGKGEALGRELGGLGLTGSNQSSEDLQKLVDQTMARWGRIDVLVNSAGHGPKGPLLELTDAQWHLGMDMYFMNVVRAVRLVAPIMVQQKAGSIVNISTAWVVEPSAMFPTSAVARAGLTAFIKLFADEHAVHQVRMNNVLPGWIDSLPAQEQRRQSVPMQRYGTSEEVAATIAFLASDAAAYITGQSLRIDGGLMRSV